jgi:hypothetical protein
MCLYTYHHYPTCGHIANWTVTSCKEYTNTLRLLSQGGLSGYCNHIQTTHDLLSEIEPDTCGQCDLELQQAVSQQTHNAFGLMAYRTIEGLNSTVPIIELSARLNINTIDEEEDYFSPISQEYRGCDCYSCTPSPVSSGVGLNYKTPSSGSTADMSQYLSNSVYTPETSTQHGNQFEIMPRDLPSEEENIADLWKALRQGSSSRDISPSSTQVGARKSRNSLHDAIPITIHRASHPLEHLNTSNPYSWTSFDLSDESPIDVESQNPYGCFINSSSFYSDTELEQSCFNLSDDSLYFDYGSKVEDPDSLTFLDDDSDADDESDAGCDLPDKFEDEHVDIFSRFISPLVFNTANAPLPPVRDSASVVDRPATPMFCPAPLRVKKPPQFLSLGSFVEDLFSGETFEEDGPDVLHDKHPRPVTIQRVVWDPAG